ncbi:MarR family winged helix-turn-helix transcriptional regulator [Sphingomonas echinoides]|uniref:MarR family transcriptional regulator n=1 Tax=Sphingomonas echinoides TaxID=59803 RepID=A0ABU4PK83_9SPHN|nr:MarR family transcriptional regulator [Sphingomonas echinoides]MDX5984379.1 MarR family transcriptional regulator [Sphingomonas echinoides]
MGEDDDFLRLDLQVCFPLYAASNLFSRLYRPVLAKLGLTYPQYLVMLVLWEQAPQSVGALGERLHLDSGTLTPLLKRMEGAGLVTRQRDAADERRVLIALTEQGMALRQQARDVPQTLASGLSLSPEELIELRASVQHLVAVLASAEATVSPS